MKAMFCAKICHPQRPCINVSSLESASMINLAEESTTLSSKSGKVEPKLCQNCRGIKLQESHRKAIEAGEWLCDEVVNACQLLLKNQYPIIGGFQSNLLADVYGMDPQPSTEFAQVLNVSRNH